MDYRSVLEHIKSRLVLSDFLSSMVSLKHVAQSVKGCCPFHEEKTPSFYVYDHDGHYHCFGCGVHGDVFDFLMAYRNMSFQDAVAYLAEHVGVAMPAFDGESQGLKRKDDKAYECLEKACRAFEGAFWASHHIKVLKYMKQRGFRDETLRSFRVGFAPQRYDMSSWGPVEMLDEHGLVLDRKVLKPRFRNRIIFPICNQRGRVVAFGGRCLESGYGPKYLNSPETPLFQKRNVLYGYHKASFMLKKETPYVVCEGYTDVMALHQAGYATAVAPLGTSLTEDHMQLMWRRCDVPLLCFDGDEAGRRAASRSLSRFLPHVTSEKTLSFVFLPSGEDPASYIEAHGGDAFGALVSRARPLSAVLWDFTQDGLDLSVAEGRARLEALMKKKLLDIKDQALRHQISQDFFGRLRNMKGFSKQKGLEKKGFSSHQRLHASRIRSHVFLSIMVNHPELWAVLEEKFAFYEMSSPQEKALQGALLKFMEEGLEIKHLRDYLKDQGLEDVLKHILRQDLYVHAPFARPGTPSEEVLKGWEGFSQEASYGDQLQNEKAHWASLLNQDFSMESWEKVRHASCMIQRDVLNKKGFEEES